MEFQITLNQCLESSNRLHSNQLAIAYLPTVNGYPMLETLITLFPYPIV